MCYEILNSALAELRRHIWLTALVAFVVIGVSLGAATVLLLLPAGLRPLVQDRDRLIPVVFAAFFASFARIPIQDILATKKQMAGIVLFKGEYEKSLARGSPSPADMTRLDALEQQCMEIVRKATNLL